LKEIPMKSLIFASSLLVACSSFAYDNRSEFGSVYVVDIRPVFQTTYQQQCHRERAYSDNSTMGTIIGGVAGGASAAARARRLSEEAEIIVLERGAVVGVGTHSELVKSTPLYTELAKHQLLV
jgi:hypothetical protein